MQNDPNRHVAGLPIVGVIGDVHEQLLNGNVDGDLRRHRAACRFQLLVYQCQRFKKICLSASTVSSFKAGLPLREDPQDRYSEARAL